MKTIKTIQYVAVGLLLVLFVECLMTMGWVLKFEEYTLTGWLVQLTIMVATVCIAVRGANDDM